MGSTARYEQVQEAYDQWESEQHLLVAEADEWKKKLGKKHKTKEPPKPIKLEWNATFSATNNPEAYAEIHNTTRDVKNCAPSRHPLDLSNPLGWDVATLFKRINERQKQYFFFLQEGNGRNKISNRTRAIRKVAATWINNDYRSLIDENANLRIRLKAAEPRTTIMGSMRVANKVQNQTCHFHIGGGPAPQPPAAESSSEGSSSSSSPSSQESGGSH
jgi:hypothetical protein